jgi:hypothetical protein
MKLAPETMQEFADALDNAREDLETGESAHDECEESDRAIIESFPAIVESGTVESVACSFVALEWLKNELVDRQERADLATIRPDKYTKETVAQYRAMLKDYRAALKYAAQLAQ